VGPRGSTQLSEAVKIPSIPPCFLFPGLERKNEIMTGRTSWKNRKFRRIIKSPILCFYFMAF